MDWIGEYVSYRAEIVDEKREKALGRAVYPTAFGTNEGPMTPYGPNTARTWVRRGIKALDRVLERV